MDSLVIFYLQNHVFPPHIVARLFLNICVYQVKTYCANFTEVNTFYYVYIDFCFVFSSPEPKALGDLIGWDSSRRPCVRPSVGPSVRSHFQP